VAEVDLVVLEAGLAEWMAESHVENGRTKSGVNVSAEDVGSLWSHEETGCG